MSKAVQRDLVHIARPAVAMLAHVYEQCGEASYENSVDVYYRRQ